MDFSLTDEQLLQKIVDAPYQWYGRHVLNIAIRLSAKEVRMSGTVKGGKKASITNKKKQGEDFYKRIGRKGGKKSCNGGFASNKVGLDGLTGLERAKIAGRKGGSVSKRGKSRKVEVNNQ